MRDEYYVVKTERDTLVVRKHDSMLPGESIEYGPGDYLEMCDRRDMLRNKSEKASPDEAEL